MTSPSDRWRLRLPAVVTLLLIALALAAWLWPDDQERRGDGSMLVFMPRADERRLDALKDLADAVGEAAAMDLSLTVTSEMTSFFGQLDRALVVLAPDGLALELRLATWQPVATGRRRVPRNLRPMSVLVSRRSAPATATPWRTAPTRTVFGDSLSMVCRVAWCQDASGDRPAGVAFGVDPYDHREVLAALRHGAYDHAVVRQWDAEQALADGLLAPTEWKLTVLSDPLPDVMVMASRRLPTAVRMEIQQVLTVLGRSIDHQTGRDRQLVAGLGLFGLDGFNLMLGPEFDRLRRQYEPCWPQPAP